MPNEPDKGEQYEKIAFNFCKIATVVLIFGRWALPVAAGAAAILYLLAHFHGKRDTRCILKKPIIIGVFWSVVAVLAVANIVHPLFGR
jgi:hypothetical protein